jgi:monothiol glutaredoxin
MNIQEITCSLKNDLDIIKQIENDIKTYPIILYMKGSPSKPQCGFSGNVANILASYKKDFYFVNILNNNHIRRLLINIADWPTYPQLWINGELIGGDDIVTQLHKTNKLIEIIKNI